ncbi:hypothetical protein DVS31_01815 [Limosilactobacillus fermentum]|nr:hypothetical protein [Limosilactobacillus fermentum]
MENLASENLKQCEVEQLTDYVDKFKIPEVLNRIDSEYPGLLTGLDPDHERIEDAYTAGSEVMRQINAFRMLIRYGDQERAQEERLIRQVETAIKQGLTTDRIAKKVGLSELELSDLMTDRDELWELYMERQAAKRQVVIIDEQLDEKIVCADKYRASDLIHVHINTVERALKQKHPKAILGRYRCKIKARYDQDGGM